MSREGAFRTAAAPLWPPGLIPIQPCGPQARIYQPDGPRGQYRNSPVAHRDNACVSAVGHRVGMGARTAPHGGGQRSRHADRRFPCQETVMEPVI